MYKWHEIVEPYEFIDSLGKNEELLVADLSNVILNIADPIYQDPDLFVKTTFFTEGLIRLLTNVNRKLCFGKGNSIVRVQTRFGGGKTHSLIALYHYLKGGENYFNFKRNPLPNNLRVVSIVGTHLNPLKGKKINSSRIKTLWGEIAYQLQGEQGYKILEANDQSQIAPGKSLIMELFRKDNPSVFLIDELTAYLAKCKGIRVGDSNLGIQTLIFLQELTECVISKEKSIILITFPDNEYESDSDRNVNSLITINQILGRVASIEIPSLRNEMYQIIQKKLIRNIVRPKALKEVITQFTKIYTINSDEFPLNSTSNDYISIMESAYPFHPVLIDIILDNWTAIPTFQGPRSILSLLATLLNEMRKKEVSNSIILPRDIDFEDKSVMNSFSRYIKERDFKIWRREIQVLQSFQADYSPEIQDYTINILKTVFMANIPLNISPNGLNLRIIKLMVWKPSEPLVLVEESLKLLINNLRYFHSRNNTFFLSDKLNYNARVHDLKSKYAKEAIVKLKGRLRTLFEKSDIRIFIWPLGPQKIGDNKKLKIILLKTPISDRSILTDWIQYKGKNRFRMYKNTLIFGIPDISVYARIVELYQTELAIEHLMGSLTYTNQDEKSETIFRLKEQSQEIKEGVSYLERKLYLSFFDGVKRFQINHPDREVTLSQWLYTELENKDIIVKRLHPELLVHEFFLNTEKIQLNSLINQFSKNISLPKTSNKQIIINSIIQGIKNGLLSLIQERKSRFKLLNEENLDIKDSDALFKSNDLFLVETKNLGTFIDNFKPNFKRKRELENQKPKMTYKLVFDKTNVEILSSLQRKVLNQITGLIDLNLHMIIETNGTDDEFKIALIEEVVDQLGGRFILQTEEE